MHRIRTAGLSLTAAGVTALALGLSAGPAVAHGGHHGFGQHFFFGHHHGHALTGVVQSVDTTTNTAVISLGGDHQSMHRHWDHSGSSSTSTRTVTLDLSNAAIFDASAMQRHCHGPGPNDGSSSAATTTLSSVQPGDVVSAVIAVNHDAARQDVMSGTAVPVSKLMDWGQQSSSQQGSGDQQQSTTHARRFLEHA